MTELKIPGERYTPERVRGAANDAFMPVPVKRRRYGRGVLWADRAGVPELDFTRLSLMRAMERKNRG